MPTPNERIVALEKKVRFLESLIASIGGAASKGVLAAATKRVPEKIADAIDDAKATVKGAVDAVKSAVSDAAKKAE